MEKCKYYLINRTATDAAGITRTRFSTKDGRIIISELDLRDMRGAGIHTNTPQEVTLEDVRRLKLENNYRLG